MIKRAPKPDHSFLIIRNAVVRDAELSYRASGLLGDILSRPDNWVVSAERLAAARPKKEGVKAIRTALKELETAGYLKRVRAQGADGKFSWSQAFFDVPQHDEAPTDVSAGHTESPKPPDGFPPDGYGPSKEVPRQRTDEEDVLNCTTSARFARSGAGAQNDQKIDDPWAVNSPRSPSHDNVNTAKPVSWRDEDRTLFRSIVGDRLRTAGGRWGTGQTHAADAFYDAYRQVANSRKGTRYEWPGRVLQKILDDNDGRDSGIEEWLLSEGLERVE